MDIVYKVFQIEYKLLRLLNIKVKSCGHYSRFEQCCNDYRYSEDEEGCFCEHSCPYGISGHKRPFITNMVYNIIHSYYLTKVKINDTIEHIRKINK